MCLAHWLLNRKRRADSRRRSRAMRTAHSWNAAIRSCQFRSQDIRAIPQLRDGLQYPSRCLAGHSIGATCNPRYSGGRNAGQSCHVFYCASHVAYSCQCLARPSELESKDPDCPVIPIPVCLSISVQVQQTKHVLPTSFSLSRFAAFLCFPTALRSASLSPESWHKWFEQNHFEILRSIPLC